jgi:hypothetical protein
MWSVPCQAGLRFSDEGNLGNEGKLLPNGREAGVVLGRGMSGMGGAAPVLASRQPHRAGLRPVADRRPTSAHLFRQNPKSLPGAT